MSMSSDPAITAILQQAIDQVIGPLTQLRATNYATAAVFTILLYDILLTLSREVEYIWKWVTSWTLPKTLYIIARYGGVVDVGLQLFGGSKHTTKSFNQKVFANHFAGSSPQTLQPSNFPSCQAYIWWIALYAILPPFYRCITQYPSLPGRGNATVAEWVVNVILMLRVHALYGRRQRFLIALISIVTIQIGCELWATVKSAIQASSHVLPSNPLLPIPGCLFGSDGSSSWQFTLVAWYAATKIGCSYKFYENAQTTGEYAGFGWKDLSPVFLALIRDGTVIYFVVTDLCISAIDIWYCVPNDGAQWLGEPCASIRNWDFIASSSYLTSLTQGTRLVLNLREAADKDNLPTYGSSTEEIATIQFQLKELTTSSRDGIQTGSETIGTVTSAQVKEPHL
ncbi:hypothetical protein M422DRAFT_51352 [Sphaerobolus stellatus SS14]|uniref:DUF6533 domain-containing protein n=1 Tax=Sphaerobolus stellatus (strain SS14) TaxID=990650 RepID=A0A0C9ULH4_SPHS4|nr:hypothetical protein M422DRAFT_51352 [Sphaerobolus stellatus SS14]